MSDFDRQEPKFRFIAIVAGLMVVLLIAIVLGVQAYFDSAKEQQVFVKVMAPESEDLKALRAREDSELYSYRFVDRARGVVRLPIGRAMELVEKEAAEGSIAWPTAPSPVKPAQPQQPPAAGKTDD